MKKIAGFTLVEMLVTLSLVGIAASVALPLVTVMETCAKETELRRSLRVMREAIDSYKTAADAGMIDRQTGASGYPHNLQSLVLGVPRSAALGFSPAPMVFLRKIPRDPFCEDKKIPDEQCWNIRAYGVKPGDFSKGTDVFDVTSKSGRASLDGSGYATW